MGGGAEMEDLRRQEVRELARLTAPLTAAQQSFFQGEYGRHRRNPTTALLLCLLLGGFGAHYFYFGKHREGVLRLLLSWSLVPAVAALFEARTIGKRAMRYNAGLANELLLAMSDVVHEQPREVAALDTLSTPMALPVNGRAALIAPDLHDSEMDSTEAALIAGAYAGREAALGSSGVHHRVATDGVANGYGASSVYATGPLVHGGLVSPAQDVAANLPASEYDTWYDEALHGESVADANGHLSAAPALEAAGIGPDAPQWVPVPEWPAAASQPQRSDPVEEWAMPDLVHQDRVAAAAHSQISAADLLDDESLNLFPELAGDRAQRPIPGVAAAAAPWASDERPAPGRESAVQPEREPVFMYEAAPALRRPAVHYGPAEPSLPRRIGEDVGLASLGSALASGLADLLRERPAPPRTRPLMQPHEAQVATFRAPGARRLEPLTPPPPTSPAEPLDPWAVSASIRAPLAESPHLAPAGEEPAFTAEHDASAAPEHDWLAVGAAGAALAAGGLLAHDGAHEALDAAPLDEIAPAESASAAADATTPFEEPAPGWHPEPAALAAAVPADYVSTPSQALRRRITHRLFVRKMAVLEGKVVAESSAERQVELVDDEAIMAQRVHQATQDAAREALEHLLQIAPPEALPAVRAQLLSLDQVAN
jgi:TM2 domain-containing membrane protein YozV